VVTMFVAAAFILGACAGGGIGKENSAVLMPQVQAVQKAAAAGNRQAAAGDLAVLKISVAKLHQEGKLDDAAVKRISASIADVERYLSAIPLAEPSPAPLQFPGDQLNGQSLNEQIQRQVDQQIQQQLQNQSPSQSQDGGPGKKGTKGHGGKGDAGG
jgi:hypothetical protein